MTSPWTAWESGRFSFQCAGFSGAVEASEDGGLFRARLQEPDWNVSLFTITGFEWADEAGAVGRTNPRPDGPYLQPPYLIVPQTVESAVGLRLTTYIRANAEGLDADFRATTTADLSRLALLASIEWADASCKQDDALGRSGDRPKSSLGVAVFQLATSRESSLCLFLDVGEHGRFDFMPTGPDCGRVECTLFGQSLEKGVIVVGRIAVRRMETELQLRKAFADWLERPASSL